MKSTTAMSFEMSLADGTRIKLDVSFDSNSDFLTTSTTTSDTAFLLQITNSEPSHHSTPASSFPPDQRLLPSTMPVPQLPKDIVAVDSGGKTYLFYVNKDRKLSYLLSPNDNGTGDYTSKLIELQDKDDNKNDVIVSAETQQVAAIAWEANQVKEACSSSKWPGVWTQGSLGEEDSQPHEIAPGSSISATVNRSSGLSLRVFASVKNATNASGVPLISVFKFMYGEASQQNGDWAAFVISKKITRW
ncbi:hypothetical protein B0T10DRAFT_560106 [Thelonectria olida]|uniref:Fucose-specific lectin n=1 Tax=Thelonectria olida TaxID=1576542 RepID=A0A9P9ANX4_9HYPO|nr:hypothetical protein B0T10DRAFT_560106 [Thelonectria olida]